jgi:hypothetical protein
MLPYAVRPLGLPRPTPTRAGQDPERSPNPARAAQSSFYGALVVFLGVFLVVGVLLSFLPF